MDIRAKVEPQSFRIHKLIARANLASTRGVTMSLAANKALAQRWFEEVWNQGKESTIDELFHPQGKAYGFPEPDSVLVGPDAFKNIHLVSLLGARLY